MRQNKHSVLVMACTYVLSHVYAVVRVMYLRLGLELWGGGLVRTFQYN